jgi:hypothetical protein
MTRETRRRLRRIERENRKAPVRFTISRLPIRPDGSPPTQEEIEISQRKTPMSMEEWMARYCRSEPG